VIKIPFYRYACANDHTFEIFLPLLKHINHWPCRDCRERAEQVITAPIFVKAAQDVCYDSPIDGRAVTSWDAHREDLKRNGCIPYDPEMKTDVANRIQREDRDMDQSVQQQAEELCEKMPTAKRAKLWSEMTEQGVSTECVRSTPTV
jgi:hypothetical protein